MATWTLADIRTKVRATTGRPDESALSNVDLDDFINKYYQLVLPKELKIFWGYTYYTFLTESGVDQYSPPSNFQTVNPRIWMDGFDGDWYLSPDLFYQDYPEQVNKMVMATGDGVTNNFTFTISAFPILIGSLYVTDGTQTAVDDGSGGFTGDASAGSIDYTTGSVSGLVFTNPPAANTNITETSETYTPTRPQGLLYYDNIFTLRPVPDNVYLIKLQGIKIPTALSADGDIPFRPDLGPLIAFGASLEIFSNFSQDEEYDKLFNGQYARYKDICMQDTYEEYMYQRSIPTF
jgi:hypothetical protein